MPINTLSKELTLFPFYEAGKPEPDNNPIKDLLLKIGNIHF